MYQRKHSLSIAAIIMIAVPAFAQLGSVSLKVEEVAGKERAGGKEQKNVSLKITVGNLTQNDLGDLQVRYFLFTKNVKDSKPVLKEIGSKRVRLDKGGSDAVETSDVEFTYVPQKNEKDKHGKSHPVPPSGDKFAGYFVQVRKSGEPVGEQLDSRLKGNVDVKSLDGQFNAWQKAEAEKAKPKPKVPPKKK